MEGVKISLQKLTVKKEGRKVSRALKEALQRIYKSLAANPDLSPFELYRLEMRQKAWAALRRFPKKKEGVTEEVKTEEKTKAPEKKRKKKPKVKRLTPNAIIKG